jgi:hypothetical protein
MGPTRKELPWVLDEPGAVASVYPKGQHPVLELPSNISFVLNVSRLSGAHNGKLKLVEGHELRRATTPEIAAIKDVLGRYRATEDWTPWQAGRVIANPNGSTSRARLPKKQWRYFVIGFEGSNKTVLEVERALCLLPQELKIGFTLLREVLVGTTAPTLIYHAGRLFSELQALQNRELAFFPVSTKIAKHIDKLHGQVKNNDPSVIGIKGFTQELLELDSLPWRSRLLFLGYFAILESLLTHQPKPTDTIDSITRQVKRKIVLLDNRWAPKIDYSVFPGSSPEKVWSTMYAYRSCLAHGTKPDFKKQLQLLGDGDAALILLKQTVKSILRQALAEPQLIFDLRNC